VMCDCDAWKRTKHIKSKGMVKADMQTYANVMCAIVTCANVTFGGL
jgi:hypothetical protein